MYVTRTAPYVVLAAKLFPYHLIQALSAGEAVVMYVDCGVPLMRCVVVKGSSTPHNFALSNPAAAA